MRASRGEIKIEDILRAAGLPFEEEYSAEKHCVNSGLLPPVLVYTPSRESIRITGVGAGVGLGVGIGVGVGVLPVSPASCVGSGVGSGVILLAVTYAVFR